MRFAEVPGPARFLLFILPLVAGVGGLGAAALLMPHPAQAAAAQPLPPDPVAAVAPAPGLLVDVSGAVARPGLYRLERGARVFAAISAAGGLAADADPSRLPDMAGVLRDGQQVKVPVRSAARTLPAAAKVDLNSATAEQLAEVPGFTGDLAALAVDYRAQYGGFVTPRELVTVLGMDEASYARARRYLVVG